MKNFRSIKPTVVGGQKATPVTNSNSNWINEALSKPATVNHDKRLYEANDLVTDNSQLGQASGGLVGAVYTKIVGASAIATQTNTATGTWELTREDATSDSVASNTALISSMHTTSPHTISRFGMAFDINASGLRSTLHEISRARIVFQPGTDSEVVGWTKEAGATAYNSSGCYVVNGFIQDTAIATTSAYSDPYLHSPSMEEAVTGLVPLPGATSTGTDAEYWGLQRNSANWTMELNSLGIAQVFGSGYDTADYLVNYWVVTPQDAKDAKLNFDKHESSFGDMAIYATPAQPAATGQVYLEILYRVKAAPFQPLS